MNNDIRMFTWVIPQTPPSLNQWQTMHWAQRKRTKEEWYSWIWALSHADHLKKPEPWLFVAAKLIFRKQARRDETNYSATLFKVVPDCFVNTGILEDDTADYFRPGPVSIEVGTVPVRDPRVESATRMVVITPNE